MDIMLLPADKSGCGLYRMVMPGRVAATVSDHKIFFGGGLMGHVEKDANGFPNVTYLPPLNVDVIIFQRPFDWIVSQCIPLAQQQGVAVVVELDDDVCNVDPMNFAYDKVQPRSSPLSNWKNVVDSCKQADWVTVSTDALRSYAPHGRVSVVPNTVPLSLLNVADRPAHDPVVVSWPGAVVTHPRDLQECGGGVSRALEATGATFSVVGAGEDVKQNLQLKEEPYATGWVELPHYPETLKGVADVGIVPLADTQFNRAKSWLKGMEMAGLGIPFVASPLPEYKRLAALGAGDLASTPYEWEKKLTRLITDEKYRAERAEQGRAVVRDHLLIENTADAWLGAWESARAYRDSRVLNTAGV